MPLHLPLEEYVVRRADRQRVAAAHERTHTHLGNAKVAIFLGALGYGAVTLGGDPRLVMYVSAGSAYLVLAVWHELTLRALTRARAAVQYYADGIARIEDRWMETGPTGERFLDLDHPYAGDLDVFGRGSLFQLVSRARTPMGEERVAAWLLEGSAPADIRVRQARVEGLRHRVDLRERIAVANAGERQFLWPRQLMAWAEGAPSLPGPLARVAVVLLAIALAAALLNILQGGSGLPLLAILAVEGGVWRWMGKRSTAIVDQLSAATGAAGLDLFSKVIVQIEAEPFDDPALAALAARFTGSGPGAERASVALARLSRVSDWADSRHNIFARLLEWPALFTPQVAYAAEAWRRRHGSRLRDWVDAVAEVEALLSLAGHAYEHPGDPFADIVETDRGEVVFDADDLAHPLIPAAVAISNSVALGLDARVLMVSGSNMSGKSTLMRTVGLNTVLALAGAPVRASRLRLSPVSVGTCLRHTDSLHEGRSGFFTEVLRIRLVCGLLEGPSPLLFLFDELLSGTNSKDRRIAAEGLVRMMVERRAIGMVTTHDLALTEIADVFPGQVRNVHLEDHVENGEMRFDYKLREGVIEHSNALELMRMIGLDV